LFFIAFVIATMYFFLSQDLENYTNRSATPQMEHPKSTELLIRVFKTLIYTWNLSIAKREETDYESV